jgi:hypothetical protein
VPVLPDSRGGPVGHGEARDEDLGLAGDDRQDGRPRCVQSFTSPRCSAWGCFSTPPTAAGEKPPNVRGSSSQ